MIQEYFSHIDELVEFVNFYQARSRPQNVVDNPRFVFVQVASMDSGLEGYILLYTAHKKLKKLRSNASTLS